MKTKTDTGPLIRYEHTTGVILAGGLSTRYGQDKAFLQIGGVPLIERIVEEMLSIFTRVILVTNQKRDFEYLELPMIEDLIKGLGPIGGIYTGLSSISEQVGFFVACDMPLLHEGLIRYMVDLIENHAAVVPSVGPWVEPLHAVYARSCLSPIKGLIDEKRYQVRLFYDLVPVRYVREDEIRLFCPPDEAFLNINTPEEFAKIQSLVKAPEAMETRDDPIR
ncbi:MAG: molybdenum cofactor guanylyltransferase [Deltaproteobacteria bacterium]|nr:molybdenum cofactor guanylyltransferase [Deltaproteobacteria bacterium]MBW2077500.1 molybdenum cofactor guanylyltransferase [Deltaproteobacteria bacterium]MBW2309771.1 molybdenum cofactor guanylyltransferase [Deltaproteobacteria bacterium]RLB26308.1 MAG: molybdenum cofactor guanylyltransferase [Deltaproteobacteria bacterium]